MALRIFAREIEPMPEGSLGGPPIWQTHDRLLDLSSSRSPELTDEDTLEAVAILKDFLRATELRERKSALRRLARNLPCCFESVVSEVLGELADARRK